MLRFAKRFPCVVEERRESNRSRAIAAARLVNSMKPGDFSRVYICIPLRTYPDSEGRKERKSDTYTNCFSGLLCDTASTSNMSRTAFFSSCAHFRRGKKEQYGCSKVRCDVGKISRDMRLNFLAFQGRGHRRENLCRCLHDPVSVFVVVVLFVVFSFPSGYYN